MKIISIASARPNFVKLAAVDHRLANREGMEHVIIHTGQHYDPLLSDVFFEQLQISQPAFNLGVQGGTRDETIARTKAALVPVLQEVRPDWVVVYGDVNGAVGGAQAAHALGIKLAHVESGLRSRDTDMPEEHNRIAIDGLADVLFCTEQSGVDNLRQEGARGRIELVGNTMIDTLKVGKEITKETIVAIDEHRLQLPEQRYAIATIHRPSNVDNPDNLRNVMHFLVELSAKCPITLPAHPRLRNALSSIAFPLDDHPRLLIQEPMDYFTFLSFIQCAAFILTDSGGIQEEALYLKKKCFTLRKNTERPCTLEANGGTNTLIDLDKPEDREKVLAYAGNPQPLENVKIPDQWDGKAGERIVGILANG